MNHPLSLLLNPTLIEKLKSKIKQGFFSEITFEQAMSFILTDGISPASDLPVHSLIKLENWVRAEGSTTLSYSATELKNKTGEILEKVLGGHTILLLKHGRAIAEIRKV